MDGKTEKSWKIVCAEPYMEKCHTAKGVRTYDNGDAVWYRNKKGSTADVAEDCSR